MEQLLQFKFLQNTKMKIKIGLVDDHLLFLDGLRALFLQDDDLEVSFSIDSVKSALNYLEKNDVDILMTDISMPEMNGIEFIKIVKEKHPHIKILILSMFQGVLPHKQVDGYIKKETPFQELVFAVKQIHKGKKYFQGTDEKKFNLEFNKNIVTTREKKVIELISRGFSTDEIAEKLYLSRGTIQTHKKIFISS